MDLSGSKSLSLGGLGFDGAIEQMSEVFGAFGGRATGQSSAFRWSTNFASAGALTLVSSRYEGEWEMWPIIERPEILVISRAHQGALDLTLGNRAAQANARSLLFASSAEADRLSLRGPLIQSDVLCIDWSIIAKMASSTFDRPLCQRRSKNRPRGGAKVGHYGAGLRPPGGRSPSGGLRPARRFFE